MRQIQFTVDEDFDNTRLDQYLADHMDFSRSYIQKLIKNKHILINDAPMIKPKHPVLSGMSIIVNIPDPETIEILPEKMELDILYEDEDLLIVNKPKGMVVHPAPGHSQHTLVNGILYHCKGSLSGINGALRPGIVHRIDKDTTGSLVVCKNDSAHQCLAKQLSEHSIKRIYNAITYHNFTQDNGTIDANIGRHPIDRKKMAVVTNGGRRAVTHYHVLDHLNNKFNWIECQLETGRTHQIRVHMAHIKHPILGDEVYGPKSNGRFSSLQGQTLHAKTIGFIHPRTNQYIEVEAPLPPYFVSLINELKS